MARAGPEPVGVGVTGGDDPAGLAPRRSASCREALRVRGDSGCLREGARSYAKRVPTQRCGPALRFRRRGHLLALLTQLALRSDVRVERHRA